MFRTVYFSRSNREYGNFLGYLWLEIFSSLFRENIHRIKATKRILARQIKHHNDRKWTSNNRRRRSNQGEQRVQIQASQVPHPTTQPLSLQRIPYRRPFSLPVVPLLSLSEHATPTSPNNSQDIAAVPFTILLYAPLHPITESFSTFSTCSKKNQYNTAMQQETSLKKYRPLSHRHINCTVTPDDASEPTTTFYEEGNKWLTPTGETKEADESPRFKAARREAFNGLLFKGYSQLNA